MNLRTLHGLAVIALFVSACATKPPPPLPPHPEVVSLLRKVQSIAILSPQVEYTRIVFTGENERLPLMEKNVSDTLLAELESTIGGQYIIRKPPEDQPEERKREMEFEVQQLRAAFATRVKMSSVEEEEKPTTRPRVTVGAAATALASRFDADAILLSRYSGFQKSGGQKAKDIMAGAVLGVVHAAEGGVVEVALIDGTTGELLWMARGVHARFPAGARSARPTTARGAAVMALTGFPPKEAPAATTNAAATVPDNAAKLAVEPVQKTSTQPDSKE
jgi:hypothetical protein